MESFSYIAERCTNCVRRKDCFRIAFIFWILAKRFSQLERSVYHYKFGKDGIELHRWLR
jgi:hypothetical protein